MSVARPCPVCGKPDWCLIAPDGAVAVCQRVESGKRCGDAGWLHRLAEPVPALANGKPRTESSKDWPALAAVFAAKFGPDRRAELAARLGLPADALDVLPLVGFNPDHPGSPCFTFPEVNATGRVVGILRRFEKGKGPNGKDKLQMKGGKRGLTLPTGWQTRPSPVCVVEGLTCAAAATAAGLAAVGRPSNDGGAMLLAELFRDLPPDRDILIVGENDKKPTGDWPGRRGAETVARRLAVALGRPVRWALPPSDTKDCRDWLTATARGETPWPERGRELLAHLTSAAAAQAPGPPADTDTRPELVIGTDEHRVNAEASATLAAEPDVYQRGGLLVHVLEQEKESDPAATVRRPAGAPAVRELTRPLLRERLTRCGRWVRVKPDGEGGEIRVPAHPPDWCVGAVHARGRWPGVRRLDGVVTHPVVTPDGSVLTGSGYHPVAGLLACLPADLTVTVPDRPTRDEVSAAVAALSEPLTDFPFAEPAHKAALIAGLLTPLAWYLFDGPAPLFLIDKNVRGAGAGLLADVVALTVTGRRFSVMSYTNDREELRKKITTLAIEGERLVLLDNLAGAVGNDVLDAALTADTWKDRVLGSNKVYDGPLHVVWFGTGNNVQLHADTSRRVCHVRMESADERPETRTGFRFPDLRGHVRKTRGRLLSAALTVLRGWIVAGRPAHGLIPWGSYEGWSGVVREAVVFAGLPDPGETRLALQTAADRDAAAVGDIIAGLAEMDPTRRGLTAAEIVARLKETDPAPDWMADMRAAVEELCGKLDARLLGYKFRHFARRNFAGRMLDRAGEDRMKGNRWAVFPATPAARHRPGSSPASPPSPAPGLRTAGDTGDTGDVSARPGDSEPGSRTRPGRLLPVFADQMLPD